MNFDSHAYRDTNHRWPGSMGPPSVYLQGSYRNHTNIAGDSDVDVVVETSRVFYSDVPHEQLLRMGFPAGAFSWRQFRDEVHVALSAHYSAGRVHQGDKCIHVGGAGVRLNADVVPCCQYRRFVNGNAEGITFWTGSGTQVVNYPEQHYWNGTAKNEACGGRYKRIVRVFKNARNAAGSAFPSYFLECLLYNVSGYRYSGSHGAMFAGALHELWNAKTNGAMAYWRCQNGQQGMFGTGVHQIGLAAGHDLVDELVNLWNRWL